MPGAVFQLFGLQGNGQDSCRDLKQGVNRAWYETELQFTETGQETPHCSAGNDMLEIEAAQLSPTTRLAICKI